MFRSHRLSLTAASLALIGAAAPLANAEPWFRLSFGDGWGSHGRGRHVVHQPPACPPPVVVLPPCPPPVVVRQQVVPCDLRFAAYQTRDTVIVIVNGTNTSGGFTTCLSA